LNQHFDISARNVKKQRVKAANEKVWPGTWSNAGAAKMIRRDLKEARAAWLPGFLEARPTSTLDFWTPHAVAIPQTAESPPPPMPKTTANVA
jgi:hypothetical protein